MLQLSRGHQCRGLLLNCLDINSEMLEMPAIKVNGGFPSNLSDALDVGSKEFKVPPSDVVQQDKGMIPIKGNGELPPSFAGAFDIQSKESRAWPASDVVQHEKSMNQKKEPVNNGDLVLQWGHRKRMRFVKGGAENPVSSNTTIKISENSSPLMRWSSFDRASDLELQASLPASDCIMTVKDSTSTAGQGPSNCSDSSHGGKPNNTESNSHGKAENKSSENRPAIAVKSNPSLVKWPKIVISLSRKEKEGDFLAIKGTKLPQRPKRRSKQAEKALQFVSPGAWLPHLTRDRYEVKERKPLKKEPRGLKEMDSMGSESE